ncbi:hypothetical protein CDAR_93801 [Caerostris darwini]|uniref:Uncharacterized protein n=1 Tax=Caerostris darwini TaxID=1538125 RepID=A0AAV4NMQ5_9ARAC|nr:hypothetical protein CDAR_93801 [Caerostris darwini]
MEIDQVPATTSIHQHGIQRTFPNQKEDSRTQVAQPLTRVHHQEYLRTLSLSRLLIRASFLFRDRICREIVFRLPQQCASPLSSSIRFVLYLVGIN